MKIKGICFDLDQTLCNSESFAVNSQTTDYTKTAEWRVYKYLQPYLKIISWERFSQEYKIAKKQIKELIPNTASSHNRYLYIQRTLENLNMRFNPDIVYKATNIYWKYIIQNMTLFPNVIHILKTLKEHHFKISILTDLTADIQNRKLQKLKIEKYIDYLVTSEEANADKPNTKGLTIALKKMNLKKDEVVMIGNNPKTDIQLAKNAGIKSVLFDYNKIYSAKEQRNQPSYYITNFKDILDILNIEELNYSNEKLIVFDMIGTLTTDSHLISSLLQSILPEKNRNVLKREYEKYKVSKISNKEFWENIGVKDSKEIEKKLIEKIELREETLKILKYLKKQHRLAILSNIPKEWGDKLSKKFEFKKYFDEIVFSGDYGIKKPDHEIYKLLLKKFPNINPNNVYFIDDDLEDLESGKNLLTQTVWLKNEQESYNFIPDFVVEKITDIKNCI